MDKQLKIKIFGKVQGVFFRQTTKVEADTLNLKGMVINEVDGSVTAFVRGSDEQLQKFVKYCRKGPEMAYVSNIIITEEELQNFSDFSIIR